METKKLLLILGIAAVILVGIVVVVAALGTVALVSGVTPLSSGVSQTNSHTYWTAASPLSINEWEYSGKRLHLTMQNNGGQDITLTGITIDGKSVFSTNTSISADESKVVKIEMDEDCGGKSEPFELLGVQLTYAQGKVSGLVQRGDKPIIGKCS